MDFNTGSGGTGSSGGPSAGPGSSPGGQRAGAAEEFAYTDPVQSFVATVRNLATRPVAFFRGMRRQGDLINPLIFSLICWEIAAILGGILSILASVAGIGVRTVGESISAFVLSLIFTPILAAIFVFVGAAILHLLVILIVRPVNTGFETTFRVVSYSWVAQLIYWIPVLGWIIGAVLWTMLAIFGVREGHATTTGKAALVVLIPVAVVLFILFILALIIGVAIFSALNQ